MPGQLQVRQIQFAIVLDLDRGVATGFANVASRGAWLDIESPGWLFGFVIPHPGLAYEFRNAPEDE
jgi:hypothetical protein